MSKFRFTLEEDTNKSLSLKKYEESDNFLEKLLHFLPTPEEELENIKKDEESLTVQVNEIKEFIEKISFRLIEIKDSSDPKNIEEYEVLNNKKEEYISLLDTYESDLSYASIQKKSLGYLIDDNEEADQKFEEQLPELFVTTYTNTKKKMEDVNSVVDILKDQSKKNKIEICIECNAVFRDAQGRKAALKHFHLEGFENLKKYKPILCIDCFIDYKNSPKCSNEELKNIEFEEAEADGSNGSDDGSNELCKRGNKIFNSKNILNSPELKEKGKKFFTLENQEFIENIRNEGKKSLFDSFF